MAPTLAAHGLDLRLGWELTPTEALLDEDPSATGSDPFRPSSWRCPSTALCAAERLAEHIAASGLTPIVAHPERAEHVREGSRPLQPSASAVG